MVANRWWLLKAPSDVQAVITPPSDGEVEGMAEVEQVTSFLAGPPAALFCGALARQLDGRNTE